MKKGWMLAAGLSLLMLAGCAGARGQNRPVDMPQWAFVDRMFTVEGEVYAVRNGVDLYNSYNSYITTESADEPLCWQLAALPNGNFSDALWHEPSGQLYFSDGYKIYGSDQTGSNRQLVWKLPDGTKKDYVRILAAGDDCLLIESRYGRRNRPEDSARQPYLYDQRNFEYLSLNVRTGEATLILSNVDSDDMTTMQPICTRGNSLWLLQQTVDKSSAIIVGIKVQSPKPVYVLHLDLLTGESRELGKFNDYGNIFAADGVVLDDMLYFMYNLGGLYSVPLSGGAVEHRSPDAAQAPRMRVIYSVEECDGEVFFLMWSGNSYPDSALCTWDPETWALLPPVATSDKTFTPTGFLVDGGNYYLFAGDEIRSGVLP